jgi:hypothetical protein
MPLSSLAVVFIVLSASPGEAVQTVQDSQIRTVWMPPTKSAIEVFAGRAPARVSVEVPATIKELEADPALIVNVFGEDKRSFWLGMRENAPPRSGLTVELALADGSELVLRVVMRPSVKDAAVKIVKRPQIDPEEAARHARERLTHCQSGEELIAGKAKLIAERGSEAVINRVFGDASLFKQNNGLSLTFVEVVHDAGVSYATLVITNQSQYDWPVDLGQIKLAEFGAHGNDVDIIARASERNVIPPKRKSRIVVAYETPATPGLVAILGEAGLLVVMAP